MLLIEIITPETSNIMIWIASGLLSILIGLVGWLGNITYKNYLVKYKYPIRVILPQLDIWTIR